MAQIAIKFVQWEVPALEKLQSSRVYKLRENLNNGGKLSREDKNWLTREVRNGTYFNKGIALGVIVKTCSDIFYTIEQKKCPMPSAKIRNYSHSHNLMSQ